MALVRLYDTAPEVEVCNPGPGPDGREHPIEISRDRVRPVLSVSLGGRAIRAKGREKLGSDYGVLDRLPHEIQIAKDHGLKVVAA